jgi:hypothetical protein
LKAGLVDHQHRIVIRQMLDDIIADDIAQGIRIDLRPRIACRHGQDRRQPQRASTGLGCSSQADLPETTAFFATRSCPNNGRIRFDLPKRRRRNASVSSIDAVCVHDVRIMVAHGFESL